MTQENITITLFDTKIPIHKRKIKKPQILFFLFKLGLGNERTFEFT